MFSMEQKFVSISLAKLLVGTVFRKGICLISCMLVVSVSLTSGPLRPLRDIYLGTTRTVSIFWETQRPGA